MFNRGAFQTISIILWLCLAVCLGQSITQYDLYIDSVKGSDWSSGSETEPLTSLSQAFSKAQSQGPVNVTFYLIIPEHTTQNQF